MNMAVMRISNKIADKSATFLGPLFVTGVLLICDLSQGEFGVLGHEEVRQTQLYNWGTELFIFYLYNN